MRSIHTLKKHLEQACFLLSKYRLDLLCNLLCGLMRVRSVNLMKLDKKLVWTMANWQHAYSLLGECAWTTEERISTIWSVSVVNYG